MSYDPSLGLQKIVMTAVTAGTSTSLPANAVILQIYARNTTGNAVTGGIKFGTTAGGVDIVAALTAAGNVISPPAVLLLTNFAGAQTINIDAVAAWNSASVDITILYVVIA